MAFFTQVIEQTATRMEIVLILFFLGSCLSLWTLVLDYNFWPLYLGKVFITLGVLT